MALTGVALMNIQKLFHVLVLGGAAITGCGDESPNDDVGDGGSAGDGGATGDSSANAVATTGSSGGSGGAPATTAGNGGDAAGAGGATPLDCSDSPDATDACGCPCCWADGPNTDEDVCGGFCGSGNDGAGCCGL